MELKAANPIYRTQGTKFWCIPGSSWPTTKFYPPPSLNIRPRHMLTAAEKSSFFERPILSYIYIDIQATTTYSRLFVQTTKSKMPPCTVCKKESSLQCNCTYAPYYCGTECQKADRKNHKPYCTFKKIERTASGLTIAKGTSMDALMDSLFGNPSDPNVLRMQQNMLSSATPSK